MVTIADFFTILQNAGVFHFYLPFVLVFAIFYALLVKSKIFGDDAQARRINAIIALVAGLYVVGFTPVGPQLISFADYLATLFTDAAVVLVTLLVFVMILYMLAPGKQLHELKGWLSLLGIVAALIVLAIFFNSGGGAIFGFVGNLGGGFFGISGQDVAVIVLILITVGVIYWLTKSGGEEGGKKS